MPPPAPVHPDWLVRSRLAQSPFGDCVLCAEREGVLEPAVLETFLADESVRSALLEPTRAPPGDALREGLARAFVDAELERHGVHVERPAVHELVARWSWDLLTELDQARSDVERAVVRAAGSLLARDDGQFVNWLLAQNSVRRCLGGAPTRLRAAIDEFARARSLCREAFARQATGWSIPEQMVLLVLERALPPEAEGAASSAGGDEVDVYSGDEDDGEEGGGRGRAELVAADAVEALVGQALDQERVWLANAAARQDARDAAIERFRRRVKAKHGPGLASGTVTPAEWSRPAEAPRPPIAM